MLAVAALLVLNLSLFTISDSSRDRLRFWPVSGGSSSTAEPPHVPETPLDISQFGERGNRVNQLAQWADLLIENPSQPRGRLEDALVTHFPYLDGALPSIYTPWSSPGNNAEAPRSSQPSFVICAGAGNFHLAAHLIRTLRRVHASQTAIEIAYAGDGDLRPEQRSFLSGLEPGISFIDLLQRFPAAERDLVGSTWAMKPFALLAAASSRAVLMDADAVFLSSPDSLFDTHPALKQSGTLFFHDRAALGGKDKRRVWVRNQLEAAGREPSTYLATESLFYRGETWWEQDSGVVALDRPNPRVLLGLIFAAWMNTKDVREQVTYQTFHGDKETYWLAMELSGFDYFFQPWYAGNIGTIPTETAEKQQSEEDLDHLAVDEVLQICGTHMLHLDHLGETPFWFNGGVYDHKGHPDRGFAELTHYLVGDIGGPRPQWSFPGDRSCLRGTGVKALPDEIRTAVQRIREEASMVDEMIKGLS